MSAAEQVLQKVAEYRSAARTIVRADHFDVGRRCAGLLELVTMSRSEPDLTVRQWSETAIWHESKAFLGVDDEALALPRESFEHRHRRLRQQGLEECPTCLRPTATEQDLQRWSQMRRAEVERLQARERAT